MSEPSPISHPGLKMASEYPLLQSIFNRRSRRIMKGVSEVKAGD